VLALRAEVLALRAEVLALRAEVVELARLQRYASASVALRAGGHEDLCERSESRYRSGEKRARAKARYRPVIWRKRQSPSCEAGIKARL